MLFTCERQVRSGHTFGFEGLHEQLGLVGGYDLVFQALEEDHGPIEALQMVDG